MFQNVNLVVADMDAAMGFYRLLGVDLDQATDNWPPGTSARHVHAKEESGVADFDLDNMAMALLWGDEGLAPGDTVVSFALATRGAVDDKYGELLAAGHRGRREPFDAFFGARYSIVEDPDGRPVGLMSPRDPSRQYTPTA